MAKSRNVDPEVASLRGRIGMRRRWNPDDVEGIAELRAELERAKLRATLKRSPFSREEIKKLVLAE